MKHRAENYYFTMWSKIIDAMDENNILEKPILFLDFEKAAGNAFQSQFPDGVIYRCYFHFTQTVLRNIKKNNLYGSYTNDNDNNIL